MLGRALFNDNYSLAEKRPSRWVVLHCVRNYSIYISFILGAIVLISTFPYDPLITIFAAICYAVYRGLNYYLHQDKKFGNKYRSPWFQLSRSIFLILVVSLYLGYFYQKEVYLKEVGKADTLWLLYFVPILLMIQYGTTTFLFVIIGLSGFALFITNLIAENIVRGQLSNLPNLSNLYNSTSILEIAVKWLWIALLTFVPYILTRHMKDWATNFKILLDIETELMDISSNLDETAFLSRVVAKISEVYKYPHVNIFELQTGGKLKYVAASSNEGLELVREGFLLDSTIGIMGQAIKTGKPYRVNNVIYDLDYVEHPDFFDTKSELAIPIRIGFKLYGVLDIQERKSNVFLPHDIELMKILADYLGWSLRNIQSMRSERQLSAIVESIASRFVLHPTLEEISRVAHDELQADIVIVYENNLLTNQIKLGAFCGELKYPGYLKGSNERTAKLVQYLLKTEKSVHFSNNLQADLGDQLSARENGITYREIPSFVERESIHARADIRLEVDGERLGVLFLNFRNNREFSEEEQQKILRFARLAALAIKKSQFQQQLEREKQFERESMAWELHDTILNDLYGIKNLTTVLLASQLNPKQLYWLENIEAARSKIVRDVRNMHQVWGRQPSDNLNNEIKLIVNAARQLYEAIEFEFCGQDIPQPLGVTLVAEFRLMISEAISNATKYSRATKIMVELEVANDSLVLNITDNGKGFDPDTIDFSGLSHMQERAKRLGGKCQISSALNAGTRIIIIVPFVKDNNNYLMPIYGSN